PGGKNTGNDLALVPPITVPATGNVEVRRSGNGSGTDTIDVLINGVLNPANIYPITNVVSLQINGQTGSNDTLLVNFGGTGGSFNIPITFNGGGDAGDTLNVDGGTFTSVIDTLAGASSGSLDFGGGSVVNYVNENKVNLAATGGSTSSPASTISSL